MAVTTFKFWAYFPKCPFNGKRVTGNTRDWTEMLTPDVGLKQPNDLLHKSQC